MHEFAHLARRQEDVVAALVGFQEAEAIPVADDRAGGERQAFHQAVFAAPVLHQLAVPQHGAEAPVQGLHVHGVGELQFAQQTARRRQGLIVLLQPLQDGFTAGDGTDVFLGFALGVGVGRTSGTAMGWRFTVFLTFHGWIEYRGEPLTALHGHF